MNVSCAKKKEPTTAEYSYGKAMKLLKDKDYLQAAEAFEKIAEDYPFAELSAKSQAMAVYSYYKEKDYTKLTQLASDFIQLNINSEYTPYMFYMNGLAYYNQIPDIKRSQDSAKQASSVFRELRARFPESDYATDVKEKLSFIDEHLAGEIMSVARYQMHNGNYVGAIKNFHEVKQRYARTNQVAEAHFRLLEIYTKLGLKKQSQEEFSILLNDFTASEWLQIAQKSLNK